MEGPRHDSLSWLEYGTMNVREFAVPSREWALFVRANRRTDEDVA